METFYRIFEVIGMLVSLLCCVSVTMAKPSRIQQKLLITCILGLTATFGNVMEVFATSPEAAMTAIKVAYIGKCYIVTSALIFVPLRKISSSWFSRSNTSSTPVRL